MTDLLDKGLLLHSLKKLERKLLHLEQTNAHDCALGIVPPAHPVDQTSRDSDDILERARERHPPHVRRDRDSELRRVEEGLPDRSVVQRLAPDSRLGKRSSCD